MKWIAVEKKRQIMVLELDSKNNLIMGVYEGEYNKSLTCFTKMAQTLRCHQRVVSYIKYITGHVLYLRPFLRPANARSQLDGGQGFLKVCQ